MARTAGLVADYLITHSEKGLTPMEVNKLTYLSHGWFLALHDKELVSESVEAWKYGPVFPSLYHRFKKYLANTIPVIGYCDTPLNNTNEFFERKEFIKSRFREDGETKTMNTVLDRYNKYNGNQLSGITHKKGSPWHQRYVKNMKHVEIPNELIKNYYKGLIINDLN